jgi:hypothetical protein
VPLLAEIAHALQTTHDILLAMYAIDLIGASSHELVSSEGAFRR